ncbi:MAG: transaldolase family protein [Myxococcota bacterium]
MNPLVAHVDGHPAAEVWLDGVPDARAIASPYDDALFSGVTTNPKLLLEGASQRLPTLAAQCPAQYPSAARLADAARRAVLLDVAARMRPRFEATGGAQGWVSAQVSPVSFFDAEAMVAEGVALAALADNMMVKVPATVAGLVAAEHLAARGVALNVTLSTTATQARRAVEALDRGASRRPPGHPWRAVLTFMVGRLGRAIAQTHREQLQPGDVRCVELMAIDQQARLVAAADAPIKLLLCSLRYAEGEDAALGARAVQLAYARGRPIVLTCPRPLLEGLFDLAPEPPRRLEAAKQDRLLRLRVVAQALRVDALDDPAVDAWPPMRINREEHLAAYRELTRRAQEVLP